jgi:hypothetical protein
MSNQVVGIEYELALEEDIDWKDLYESGDPVYDAEAKAQVEAGVLEYYQLLVKVRVHYGKGGERDFIGSLGGIGVLSDTTQHLKEAREYLRSEIREVANEAFAEARNSAKVREQSIREAKVKLEELMDRDPRL